jgi:hypothetical protein
MADPARLQLFLATDDFDISLLPLDARQRGTAGFREAARMVLSAEFERVGGWCSIEIDNEVVTVNWTTAGRSTRANRRKAQARGVFKGDHAVSEKIAGIGPCRACGFLTKSFFYTLDSSKRLSRWPERLRQLTGSKNRL